MPDHPAMRLAQRLMWLLLNAYPAGFRQSVGNDLLDVHRDRCRDEWLRSGWFGLVSYWLKASAGILRDGISERLAQRRSRDITLNRDLIGSVKQDLRYGMRSLVRRPGFSASVILTLALGIGVNAAIFSIVDGVLLRSLPYPEADRLVRVWGANTATDEAFVELSYEDYVFVRDNSRSFDGMAAFSQTSRDLVDDLAPPMEVVLGRVAHGLFPLLSATPVVGRGFIPEDAQRRVPVVVLSHGLWQRRYGGDSTVIGRTLAIRAQPFAIVGVLPPAHGYPLSADLWRPLNVERQDEDREFHVIARLARGVTVEAASAELRVLAARLERANPDLNEGITAWVQPMQTMLVRDVRTPLFVLLGAVGFVLLIACANVSNLLLARSTVRQHEVAVRTALGASRGRIVRQLLTESLLLASLGGGAGLLVGHWALGSIVAASPRAIPRLSEVALDGRVVLVMAAATMLAAIIFGLLPSLHTSNVDLQSGLRGEGRAWAGSSAVRRVQRSLVVTEIALATVLAIGASLLITSFGRMLRLDRGFATENILVVPVYPGTLHLRERARVLFDEVQTRVERLPGVRSVVLSTMDPINPRGLRAEIQIDPDPDSHLRTNRPVVRWHSVSRDFFSTMGIPLLAGRVPGEEHNETGPRVITINAAFADAYFPGEDPVGRQLQNPQVEIIGVVGNVTPLAKGVPRPTMYSPYRQLPMPGMLVVVRTAEDPLPLTEAIRQEVWAVDPTIPLDDITTLERAIAETVAAPRFNMLLVGSFASLALVLATIGIYGVMAYAVSQRTREIGLRQALGAAQGNVLGMVMRQGLTMAAGGVAAGLIAASWLTRLLTTQLYDVDPTDPVMFGAVALLLGTAAAAACYVPARRATRVDPTTALRYE